MRDYKLYLKDILLAIESIERFVEGLETESFKHDDKTSSAVIRKFEIIGEAQRTSRTRCSDNTPAFPGKRWQE